MAGDREPGDDMGSVEHTRRTGRVPVGLLAVVAAALSLMGCGSNTETTTTPTSTPAAMASSTTTSSTDSTDETATPGAVSGAAALGGAAGNRSGDKTTDTTADDTTSDEGVLAETGADEVAPDVTWELSATEYRGEEGLLVAYECPADGTLGPVWGTDAYTDDSSVCTAAVHLGLIRDVDGGIVVIQISDGLDAYEGSTANGVTTGSYGAWSGTFTFVG